MQNIATAIKIAFILFFMFAAPLYKRQLSNCVLGKYSIALESNQPTGEETFSTFFWLAVSPSPGTYEPRSLKKVVDVVA